MTEFVYTVTGDGYFDKFTVSRVEIIKRGPATVKVTVCRASGYRRILRNDILKRDFSATPAKAIERWRKATAACIRRLKREVSHLERAIQRTPRPEKPDSEGFLS